MRIALGIALGLLLLAILHSGLRPYWRAVEWNGKPVSTHKPLGRSWLWAPEFRLERRRDADEIEEEWERKVAAELTSEADKREADRARQERVELALGDADDATWKRDERVSAALSAWLTKRGASLYDLGGEDILRAVEKLAAARRNAQAQYASAKAGIARSLARRKVEADEGLIDFDDETLDQAIGEFMAERAQRVPLSEELWDVVVKEVNAKHQRERQDARARLQARGVTVSQTEESYATGTVDWMRTLLEAGALLACAVLLAITGRRGTRAARDVSAA